MINSLSQSANSSELTLDIQENVQKLNPYANQSQKKINKRRLTKKEIYTNIYEPIRINSHVLLLVSIMCICLYYSFLFRVHESPIQAKFYHSFCLGVICLLDFLINRDYYKTIPAHEEDQRSLNEQLLSTSEEKQHSTEKHSMSQKEFYCYSILLGILTFFSELLTFYLLFSSIQYHHNISIAFALLSLEYLFVRFHYSLNHIKIELINFLGILLIFIIAILISITYLNLNFALIGLLISVLRFFKFYIYVDLTKFQNPFVNKITIGLSCTDFAIGMFILLVYILQFDHHEAFQFSHFFLVSVGTLAFYINIRFFTDFDR